MVMLASVLSLARVRSESSFSNPGDFRRLSTVLELGCFLRATSENSNSGSVLVWPDVIQDYIFLELIILPEDMAQLGINRFIRMDVDVGNL